MENELFTADFKTAPYWWDHVPRPAAEETPLPTTAEVAIVGAGYTGLSAALQTARGGRHTVVVDAEAAGWGCSTRNGGQISTSVKPGFAELSARHGPERAFAILKEGHEALAWIGRFVAEERIDCGFSVCGRFHAAHNARQYERLARAVGSEPKGLETDAVVVPRAEQRRELGSDAYFGGVVYPRHASVDPARLHDGLRARAQEAGVTIVPHCRVRHMARNGRDVELRTDRGTIRARNAIVASNGYTGPSAPWLRRRIIPIGSYVIATEAIPATLMARLMPKNRIVSDTRKVVYYYRPSPDGSRILFGGRVSLSESDPLRSAPLLHAALAGIFPELAAVRVSHSWMGFVAYTFDTLAHLGEHDGIHYAMGYCGSGVSMASYLGMRIGQQVLGRAEGRTAFDGLRFQTRPFYSGNPWFLAPSVAWYRLRDRLGL
ncbi:MAG: oxidoreductase [Alphaproteobacteria bacterium]|nr:MAG: oxidoreductase [Alphaproteobacteria bacterium]